MERNGKALRQLPDGAPRRLSDGRNAWRKMDEAQRAEFLSWIVSQDYTGAVKIPPGYEVSE